ncbi:MAG TPA: stage V sporulation protein AD [Candidatus Fimousia stercorigallinarum]|nr:stage V sporulation protein AD [Candidatus Fimousia stercorigallinarum]
MGEMIGKQSIQFSKPPYLLASSSIVGQKEKEGPLGKLFDEVIEDPMAGEDNWEKGESEFMKRAIELAIQKSKITKDEVRYLFAGDLLGQLIATSFGVKDFQIPIFGIYGACSSAGEGISLASMAVAGGYADYAIAASSSHFGSAEKQFRFPLEYGNQRPLSSTWTVTGSGAFVISKKKSDVQISGITTGKIVDYGIKDSMNMGAAMAPAAAQVIYQHLQDFQRVPDDYDRIVTGDLGTVGQKILIDLLKENDYDISKQHMDCGIEIYSSEDQDTNAGGSGCACSAVTLSAFILPKIQCGEWKRVLFVPTGALLSTVSFNEGQSVPGIAHGVLLERSAK